MDGSSDHEEHHRLIVIAALLLIFQNTETGAFSFLFFDIEAPRWVWLLAVFAAGFASGHLFARNRAQSNAAG